MRWELGKSTCPTGVNLMALERRLRSIWNVYRCEFSVRENRGRSIW